MAQIEVLTKVTAVSSGVIPYAAITSLLSHNSPWQYLLNNRFRQLSLITLIRLQMS